MVMLLLNIEWSANVTDEFTFYVVFSKLYGFITYTYIYSLLLSVIGVVCLSVCLFDEQTSLCTINLDKPITLCNKLLYL